jgi:dethiobiotin synthetase
MERFLSNLQPNGIFITGTDTGIGKTVVSAILLCALKSAGADAVYMKPVQTGCPRKYGKMIAPDLEFACSLAGIHPPSYAKRPHGFRRRPRAMARQVPRGGTTAMASEGSAYLMMPRRLPLGASSEKEQKLMAPYRFTKACSPHLAATLEKRRINLPKIMQAFAGLKRRHEFVIVEGAGGILTPLARQLSMLDLMKALSLPVIVVARPGLGTINHTLLTLRELRRAKLDILGVVINYTQKNRKTVIEKDNLKTIERLGDTRIIAELPFMRELQTGFPCSRNILVKLRYNLGRKLSLKFGMGLNKPHDIR